MATQNIATATGIVTTTSQLNVRAGAPNTAAAIAMKVEAGCQLTVSGITTGEAIDGNPQWYAGLNNLYFWSGACTSIAASAAALQTAAPASGNVLSGRVEGAPPAARGFDRTTPLTKKSAADFRNRGFRFCVRYITRAYDQESSGDLSRAEADIILDAGLALMAVQHCPLKNWTPTEVLGQTYGANAVKNAQQVGLPPGVNIWLDLEGVRGDTPAQSVIDYCNAWFAAVETAGFASGVYIGDSIVISADDLYWNLKTKHYWKSGSDVPDIPHRGYQMIQRIPKDADDDQNVDTDVTQTDAFGDAVQWLTRT